MRRYVLLTVALAPLLAGCGGIADGDAADRDPYGVEDPVDPTADRPELLPGLTTDGLEDEQELLENHERLLENETYTVYANTTVLDENGSAVFSNEQRTYRDGSAGQAHVLEEQRGVPQSDAYHTDAPDDTDELRAQQWAEDTLVLQRFEYADGAVAFNRPALPDLTGSEPVLVPGGFRIHGHVRSIGTSSVETREIGGSTYHVIDAETPDPVSSYVETEPYSARAYVDDDGLIHRYESTGTVVADGKRLTITEEWTLLDVGETTVERPEWYERAIEETREPHG